MQMPEQASSERSPSSPWTFGGPHTIDASAPDSLPPAWTPGLRPDVALKNR